MPQLSAKRAKKISKPSIIRLMSSTKMALSCVSADVFKQLLMWLLRYTATAILYKLCTCSFVNVFFKQCFTLINKWLITLECFTRARILVKWTRHRILQLSVWSTDKMAKFRKEESIFLNYKQTKLFVWIQFTFTLSDAFRIRFVWDMFVRWDSSFSLFLLASETWISFPTCDMSYYWM